MMTLRPRKVKRLILIMWLRRPKLDPSSLADSNQQALPLQEQLQRWTLPCSPFQCGSSVA